MAAGKGGLQLEEPSSRRAGLAGGEGAGAPAARPQGRAPAPGGGSLEGRAGLPGTTGRARRRGEVGGGDGTRESPSRRAEVGVGVWDWESRIGRLRVSLSSSRSWAAGPARFERWLVAARELLASWLELAR